MKKKLPENAKQVYKGPIFEVYQWEQEMYDGSIATFEQLKRPDTVTVIAITKENKFILSEEEQPHKGKFTSIPGGRVDEGESSERAAKRELREETGYVSEAWQLLLSQRVSSKIKWDIHLFLAKDCELKAAPELDNGERVNVKLLEYDEFFEWMMSKDFHDYSIIHWALRGGLLNASDFKENLRKFFYK